MRISIRIVFTDPSVVNQVECNMTSVEAGFQFLKKNGLNLISVMNCVDLPARTLKFMQGSGIPIIDYRRLVLIGHGGRCMWQTLKAHGMDSANPIDRYSIFLTQQFISTYLDNAAVLWLYPTLQYVVPLQQLGEFAGWSFPSPLGSGISSEYGVWFAYRAAFLINAELPLTFSTSAPSPCNNCFKKPCVSACPVNAVQVESFALESCIDHRLSLDSPCADRCPARLACPIHPEHRYTLEQIRYHYRCSLAALHDWYGH